MAESSGSSTDTELLAVHLSCTLSAPDQQLSGPGVVPFEAHEHPGEEKMLLFPTSFVQTLGKLQP